MTELRRTQRRIQNKFSNEWVNIEFSELQEYDVFRLFEPTGESVKDSKGNTEFIANSNAFLNQNGIWTVDVVE